MKKLKNLLLYLLGRILRHFGYQEGDTSIPKERSEKIAIEFTCICSLVYAAWSAYLMLGTEGTAAIVAWMLNLTCVLQTLSSLFQRHKEYMSRKMREYKESAEDYAEAYVKEHIPDSCAGGVFESISAVLDAEKEPELADIKAPKAASPYKARGEFYVFILICYAIFFALACIAWFASHQVLENGLGDGVGSVLLVVLAIIFLGIGFLEVLIEQSVAWFRAEP